MAKVGRKQSISLLELAELAESTDNCVDWPGFKCNKGYGKIHRINFDGQQAHRAMWVYEGNELPEDMTIDHLCGNKACVNVKHMEVVTDVENTKRRGNPYDPNVRSVK